MVGAERRVVGIMSVLYQKGGKCGRTNAQLGLETQIQYLEVFQSCVHFFRFVSNISKKPMKRKHDLFWFIITEASVHGPLATSLRDYG